MYLDDSKKLLFVWLLAEVSKLSEQKIQKLLNAQLTNKLYPHNLQKLSQK